MHSKSAKLYTQCIRSRIQFTENSTENRLQAAEFLQNGSQVFWLDINYQFNILRLASTLNTAIGGANFSSSQLDSSPNSSLRSQLKSQLESFDQSLPQTQINDNLRRIKVTRCDTFASVELTLQSFLWRMDEGQIKTENKYATELVLIMDSISSLIDRDSPEQDVLGTVVLKKTPLL